MSQNAIPLASLNAGSGFHDLRPLKSVLRDVRIVALGEATHGTREFFQFKHLMLEFLAKELGFTVFGIEASYAECLNINDYVLHAKGDRSRALTSQGFWTWDTEEVLRMIDWIREYNMGVTEPRRIKFYGFDFQQHSHAADVVLKFLKKVAPTLLRQPRQGLHSIGEVLEQASRRSKPSELRSTVHELIRFMQKDRLRLSSLSSEEEFEKALIHARMLAQFVEMEAAKAARKGDEVI